MYSWVTEQLTNIKTLREQKISELADYYKQKAISLAQGVCARSALDADPTTIETSRLKARFDNQPGYALFEGTPYLIEFKTDKAVVTKMRFRRSLNTEQLEAIKVLFPEESEPLDKQIDANLDEITKAIKTMSLQDICARSALNADPTTIQTCHLKARFGNQPGYALFKNTPYLIEFSNDKVLVTKLSFKHSLNTEQLDAIKALFPEESEPLDKQIDANLDEITKAIEPLPTQGIRLNHALLRPYFSDPSTENVPFIKFSDIWLIKINTEDKVDEVIESIRAMQEYENQPILMHQITTGGILSVYRHIHTYHFYGNTNGNKWCITKLDIGPIAETLNLEFSDHPILLPYALQHALLYQHINEKDAHTHFSEDPQQVTFIQNIINALHFIKKVFLTIEKPSTAAIAEGIKYLFGGAVPVDAYEILKYFTEIDIDFTLRFKDEILEFSYALERFYQYSQLSTTNFSTSFSQENLITWPFQLGNAAGLATRFIYDPNDEMDMHALSQFSVDLPKHIDTFTTFLNANTDTVTQRAPHINQDQLHELQKEATHLLNKLRSAQEHKKFSMNPIRQMLQIINYALLIRHLIILISGTVNQIGFLHEAYQELLRTYLQILKYQIFPRLMACAFKIEIELILEPGSLWRPLLQYIIGFYAFLTPYIKNLADFSKLGPELLVVEDGVFWNECQTFIQTLMDESKNNQLKLQWAETAAKAFFNPQNNDRDDLKNQYVLIQPYLKDINPEANNTIIKQFNENIQLTIPDPILLKSKLFSHLKKLGATEILRLKQCHAVLKSTDSYSNLQLFPYRNRTGCDIALVNINGPLNIAKLQLSKLYPVLFRYKDHMMPQYMLYGNTDGRHWDFSPIAEPFVDEEILVRFEQTLNGQSHILPYHPQHGALYQHMAKKAHTHYVSQLDCDESSVFEPKEHTVQLVFKPFDYLNSKLPNPKPPHKPDTFLEEERRQDELNNLPMTQFARGNAQIEDLNNLSADEALTLYAWYQHKIRSFEVASKQIKTFRSTIRNYFTSPNGFRDNPKLRRYCQRLYFNIQPYLIGMRNFPTFDHAMIAAFSKDTTPPQSAITRQNIEQYFANFSLTHAKERIDFWKNRADAILIYAENKHKETYRHNGLATHTPKEAKADLLLKDKHLSANIQKFRIALQEWIPSLRPGIQAQLQPATNGLPFPEIQDNPQNQLRQIPTVLLFKRIFNATYHLQQIATYIEQLHRARNNTLKAKNTKLATDLWNKHGIYLWDLGPQLYNDPILASIAQNFKRQYKNLLGQIATLFQPYATNAMTVEPTDQTVQYNGLWYTVNAVYLIPDHLIYLTQRPESMSEEQRKLIPEEQQRLHRDHLQKLQIAAKQTSSHIERIIRDSGSYFKLFLASTVIYRLNMEIRQKLKDFASTTQGVALSHLELLYQDYFTPMLEEGDLWEARLGLNPGKITRPLKIIIDAWYQGWLFSLDIPFEVKETLACDHTVSYDRRILAETMRLNEAEKKLEHAQDIWDADAQNKLTTSQREKALAESPVLRDLALGRQAEHEFTIQSAEEKLHYLKTAKLNYALDAQNIYRSSFAKHYIKTHISSLHYYALGMTTRDVHQEYTRELKAFIESQKDRLLASIEPKEYISRETEEDESVEDRLHIQPPDNIECYLSQQLKEVDTQFQTRHFAAYRRLDQIQQAIESFQTYLKRDKTISTELRDRKLQCLEDLSTALQTDHHHPEGESLDVRLARRLNRIKENIEQSKTETILLEHHPRYASCFAWLVNCLVQLMTAIGLYTPARQKHYNALLKAAEPIAPPAFLNFWSPSQTSPARPISANDRRIVTPSQQPRT
ncbi:MAG: hypothetical protein NXI01_00110 [Gammaproteobacteria bacterium]|nr:hypothetical protein [Gammaproteobacteria bacterium]